MDAKCRQTGRQLSVPITNMATQLGSEVKNYGTIIKTCHPCFPVVSACSFMLIHVAHIHGLIVDPSQVLAANQCSRKTIPMSLCLFSVWQLMSLFLSEHTNSCITALCCHGSHYLPAVQYRVITLDAAEKGVAIISVSGEDERCMMFRLTTFLL